MERDLPRRAFLAAVSGAATTVALWVPMVEAAPSQPTWALDATTCGTSCACAACTHHAANKLFATQAAAGQYRAHAGCKCVVVPGQPLSAVVHQQLFASSPVADRRHAATAALLAGQTEQHSTPMLDLPAVVVAGGGAAALLWLHRRRVTGAG